MLQGNTTIKKICPTCSDDFRTPQSVDKTYCERECANEAFRNGHHIATGEDSNFWQGGTIDLICANCGDTFPVPPSRADRRKYCDTECMAEAYGDGRLRGKGHPNWKGGLQRYYGENWSEQREKALERDNRECVVCGRGEDEIGREPDVHHITPIREFGKLEEANSLSNLITLCRKHHFQIEGWNLIPENAGDQLLRQSG